MKNIFDMKKLISLFFLSALFSCTNKTGQALLPTPEIQDLVFNELSESWDEAMPLGNGMVGNLIWQKNGKLRFSLDRADLWDLRPMENIDFDKWKFNDVYAHWKEDQYDKVQEVFDVPYNILPAPSKIPAGALFYCITNHIQIAGKTSQHRVCVQRAALTPM